MSDDPTGDDESVVGDLVESVERARLAAEAVLNVTFTENAVVGYGHRSMVFLTEQAVLKVYTHRWRERACREAAGLRVAAHAPDLRLPDVLAHDEVPGRLSWLGCTRLSGTPPAPDAEITTPLLGQVAARLHTLPAHEVDELAEHRHRLRKLPDGRTPRHQAARELDAALTEAAPVAEQQCTRGFVHGDYSSRNILLADVQPPGIIDFEGSGAGCCYTDLAALVLHESLLGPRDCHVLLASYDAERRRLDPTATAVDGEHLAVHLLLRARWIMQWALTLDPDLAGAITDLTPWLLAALAGTTAIR